MSFTPITKDQWKSIGKVALFITGSIIVTVAVAYASNQPAFILYMPLINLLAVIVSKFFIDNELKAISLLPIHIQVPVATATTTVTTDVTAAVESALNIQTPPTSN